MKEIVKTPGRHIDYTSAGNSILFGEDDLAVNLRNRERDEVVVIDICSDRSGALTMGTAAGLRYVAQVEIPARRYIEVERENPSYDPEAEEDSEESKRIVLVREAMPFDVENCTIYLWGMEE